MPYDIIKIRRDSYVSWESVNPVLSLGEISYDLTNKEIRVGDGSSAWLDLTPIGSGTIADGDKGDIVVTSSGTTWSLDSAVWDTINGKLDAGPLDGGDANTSVQVIQIRRDTTTGWNASATVLPAGEMGYDSVTNEIRVGDGINTYADLVPIGVLKMSGITLQNIGDVDYPVEAPQDGQVLTWNAGISQWVNLDIPEQTFTLNDITDVILTAPENTDILQFNGVEWVNAPAPTPTGSGVTAGPKNEITVIDPDDDWIITPGTIEPIAGGVVENYIEDRRNQPNGIASLDNNGLIPSSLFATNDPQDNYVLLGNQTWGLPTITQNELNVEEPTALWHVATKHYVDDMTGMAFEAIHDRFDSPLGIATLNLDSKLPLTTLDDGGATTGQALVWDGSQWEPGTLATFTVGELSDVNLFGLVPTDILMYVAPHWINIPASTLNTYHTHSLSQITIPTPQKVSGRLLWWNNDTEQLRTVSLDGSGLASLSHDNTANTMTVTVASSHPHAPSDITSGGATSGQILSWSGTEWAPTTPTSGGATNLDSLSDVVITGTPGANEVISHNGTNWVNRTLSSAGIQPLDATLTALAGVATSADKMIYATGSDTFSTTTVTSYIRTLLDDTSVTSARATLGLTSWAVEATALNIPSTPSDNQVLQWDSINEWWTNSTLIPSDIGSGGASSGMIMRYTGSVWAPTSLSTAGIQPLDATLTAFAGVTTATDKLIYATGSDSFSTTDFTSTARTLLDDTSTSAMRTTLGLTIGTDVASASHTHTLSNITDAGTMASQNASSVAITGGTITGATVTTGTYSSPINEAVMHLARKDTAGTITKGQVVRIVGSSGSHLTVELADASVEATSKTTLGIAAESITNTTNGYVITAGELNGLSNVPVSGGSENFVDGTPLWLSETAGNFTQTRPTQPAHGVVIGHVISASNGSSGRIHVSISNGHELDEIHDVLIASQADKDLLAWDNSAGVWKNMTKTTAGFGSLATLNSVGSTELTASAVTTAKIANSAVTPIKLNNSGTTNTLLGMDNSGVGTYYSAGSGITIDGSTATISLTGGSGAPTTATYIVQTSDGTLTNEQALASLSTGILKNTTTTGVLSIATGSDLPSHTHAASDITSGTVATARLGSGTANSSSFLRGDQTWQTVTAAPGGSTTQVQYNNAGSTGGAANVAIDSGNLKLIKPGSTPSNPAADSIVMYPISYAGREFPAYKDEGGFTTNLQVCLAKNKIRVYSAGNANAVAGVFGFPAFTTVGTLTARNFATTSLLTTISRHAYVSAASTANAWAQMRSPNSGHFCWRGSSGSLGGFYVLFRFAISDATLNTGGEVFVGLSTTLTAMANGTAFSVESLADSVGLYAIDGATNYSIGCNDNTGNATLTSLGSSFPVNITDFYELILFAKPNDTAIYYEVTNITTGANTSGTLSTDLPRNTVGLGIQIIRGNNASTSSAPAFDISQIYAETQY